MTFTIITPSFKQLDWLRLCVASVRDQIPPPAGISEIGDRRSGSSAPPEKSTIPPLAVEHIIQDAGSPGIEDFAREVGADFYRDGALVFASTGDRGLKIDDRTCPSPISGLQSSTSRYRIAIYCESDSGMYDAINRGLARSSGEICAWLNCDEQYLAGTLGKVAEIFSGSLDVLLGDALLVDSQLQPVCYRRIMVPSRWHTRLDHLHSLSCAMFFRRSALPGPPLDPRWKVIGDAVLMDHFLGSGKRVRACGELLSAYAFTGSNLSAKPSGELERWWAENRWPPRIFQPFVVVLHRIRRYLCHAYRSHLVETALWKTASGSRVKISGDVPGIWPTVGCLGAKGSLYDAK